MTQAHFIFSKEKKSELRENIFDNFFSKPIKDEFIRRFFFQAGEKVNARLGIIDIQVFPYSGGERTKLILKDAEGTEIEGIGFQDVRNICQQLKIGKTYVFHDVIRPHILRRSN